MFHGSLEGGNAREIFCWPFEPHGRRLAAPSTAASGGSPPRDVKIIFCLYGNPRGGGLRRGLVPAGHMDVPCVTTMWNSNLFDSTRGGNPPPRCRCFNLHYALGPGPGRPFGPRTWAFCHTMFVLPNLGSRQILYPPTFALPPTRHK